MISSHSAWRPVKLGTIGGRQDFGSDGFAPFKRQKMEES